MPPVQIPSDNPDAVAEVLRHDGGAPVCLVCEHASAAMPSSLGALGLAAGDRFSHAAWDIGAEALARELSAMLDAPLVIARVSRLVYDLNRPPEAPDAIPSRVEVIDIPGNRDLSPADRTARAEAIYVPFHTRVSDLLDSFASPPALVTIHSFTPHWHGVPRPTEIGLLHDADPSLARAMLAAADPSFRTELNQPYSAADGVTHTLRRHANPRGLSNVMIEVRNDLLADETGTRRIAGVLAAMLSRGLSLGADAA